MPQKSLLSTMLHYLKHRFNEVHPIEVQALLLNGCNLKCVYCRYPEMKTSLMTTEQWIETIRGLAKLGTLRVKFQGGEPTLRKDFRQLSAEAQESGIITAVITNGSRISEDPTLADFLNEIVVSLDSSDQKTHDWLRGEGSYNQAMRCIEIGLERSKKVYVVAVISKKNFDHLENLLDFCVSKGIRMHAQPLMLGKEPFDETSRHLALSDDQTRELHHRMAIWKRKGMPVMFSAGSYERVAEWKDFSVGNLVSNGPSPCMAGRFYLHIEANGDVWPCGHHGADFEAKNVLKDGLVEAVRRARHHNCIDCPVAYLNERKALFSFKPTAILQFLQRG